MASFLFFEVVPCVLYPPTLQQKEPDVKGAVLVWTTFLFEGTPNVRFHVNWWEGAPFWGWVKENPGRLPFGSVFLCG